MSMEISNRYEKPYSGRVWADRQETEENAINNEKENIPVPKDEYISSEKSDEKTSGLYRMGRDEKGNPKIIYDGPGKARKGKALKPAEPDAEKTTVNTDQVDREIEKLKEEKEQIEQRIKAANGDEKTIRELQKKLARIEGELNQKDNDTYRRQHAAIS